MDRNSTNKERLIGDFKGVLGHIGIKFIPRSIQKHKTVEQMQEESKYKRKTLKQLRVERMQLKKEAKERIFENRVMEDILKADFPELFKKENKQEIAVPQKYNPVVDVAKMREFIKNKTPAPYKKVIIKSQRTLNMEMGEQKKKPPFVRPKAVYDNIPSPYGIASEMLTEQLNDK